MRSSVSREPGDTAPGGGSRWSWLRPLAEWFFCYPLLFVETAGLLLIVLAEIWDPLNVNRIGLASLFWHESMWIQATAGVGISLVLGEVCLVGYLLDAERAWTGSYRRGESPRTRGTSWWYFFGTLTYPLLVLLAALPAAFAPQARWALPAGLLAGSTAIAFLSWFGGRIRPENSGCFDWLINLPQLRQTLPDEASAKLNGRRLVLLLSREQRQDLSPYFHLHAFQVFVSIVLLLVYGLLYVAAAYYSDDFVSPALAICVLTALVTTAYGFIVFHFPLRHFGVFCLIVLAYIGVTSFFTRQHRLAGLDYARPVALSLDGEGSPPAAGLLDNQEALNAWRGQFPRGQRPVMVVLAVKGGGARSAAWSTAVLSRLEQELPDLPYHTRLVSGASGGMLGATYYVATLNPPRSASNHTIPCLAGPSADLQVMVDNISKDSLSPVARQMALPLRNDRGEALEHAWEENTCGILARGLGELRESERAGWRPSLLYSPMLVEDGRRLIISNLNLDFLTRNAGSFLSERKGSSGATAPYSVSGWQFFELFPYARDVRLSTVARMNASFPYITPDAELPTTPTRRVVDASYYDGYGVNLAALWIYHCREWIRQNTAGVVLLQVRDRPRNVEPDAYWPRWKRTLAAFTTPLEGAVHAREASMSYRNDELLEWLDGQFNRPADRDFFTTVVFEYPDHAPLSWYLPPEDLQRMKAAVQQPSGAVAAQLQLLKDWWSRREKQ
jgi:hypothetical protein